MNKEALKREARRYLAQIRPQAQTPLLGHLNAPDAVYLGRLASGARLQPPLDAFNGTGLITGANGSGKTMAILPLIERLIQAERGFTALDAKGELFERCLYILYHYPEHWDRVT